MSQSWTMPIAGTDTFSASRTDINNDMDALYTNFIGTADPGTLAEGNIWINTTSNTIKGRKAGPSTITLGDWADNLGHLRKDGTIALTGAMSCGSQKLTSLANGTVSGDAVNFGQLSGYLPLAGGAMNSAAVISYTSPPALSANNLTHKTYCDGKLLKTGDTATGRLLYSGVGASTFSGDILSKLEVQDLITFNTTVGHRHTGSDSRKILATNLDAAGAASTAVARSDGGGGVVWSSSLGTGTFNSGELELTVAVTSGTFTYKFSGGLDSTWAFIPFLKVSNATNVSTFYIKYFGYGPAADGGSGTSTSYNCDVYAFVQATASETVYVKFRRLLA